MASPVDKASTELAPGGWNRGNNGTKSAFADCRRSPEARYKVPCGRYGAFPGSRSSSLSALPTAQIPCEDVEGGRILSARIVGAAP